jgi:protease PrsW
MWQLIAILTIGPALLLLFFLYRQDKQKPESAKLIIKTFLIGLLSVIPALIAGLILLEFESRLGRWSQIFFASFITAGLVEESSKLLMLRIAIWNHTEFDEVTDGMIYMITVGLAFAAVENLLYGMEGDLITIILRAVTAVPGHAIFGGIMGYFIGKARVLVEHKGRNIVLGLGLAILLHGTYDVCAFGATHAPWLLSGVFGIVILGFIGLLQLFKKAQRLDRELGLS